MNGVNTIVVAVRPDDTAKGEYLTLWKKLCSGALLIANKRIIISNEIKQSVELDGNKIKKIASGGDTLIGRTHCKEEQEFITQFLPVVLCNDINKISPYDDAVDNRVRCLTYEKNIVENE